MILDICLEKVNLDAYFKQYMKMNSRCIVQLNVIGKMTKLEEENIGEINNDFEVGKDFLNKT